jgi:predicted ATP-dependent Lon-type protease
MTSSVEMDHFDGYLVRKDLVRKYSRQYPVPTYVVEFLLGRYCATTDEQEIEEGLEIVEKQLKDRTVRTGEEELFKARAREEGLGQADRHRPARLDAKNDCYVAELPSLALRDVRSPTAGARQRADADRRLLRRGDADLRRHHRAGEERPAVRDREVCGRSRCRSPTCWTRWRRRAAPVHDGEWRTS